MNDELRARLEPSLRIILELELRAGNEILSWGEGDWSIGKVLLVQLARPFSRRYEEFSDVQFLNVNDPHYWGEEISSLDGHQGLTTPFIPRR